MHLVRFVILFSFFGTAMPGIAADWLDHFNSYVTTEVHKHRVPGFVFAFVEKDQPPRIVSYGKTRKNGDQIDQDTLFRLASVSKTFTSVLMARMVEQQQLQWQTPVTQLAPNFGFAENGHDDMQLGHIIGQSSGYMPNAYDNLIEANYPVKRVLNELADLPPLCQPGQCYTYQNALFGVLEQYFSNQNSSYPRALQQYVFDPLAMPNASTGKASLLASENWARPHIAIRKDRWREGQVESNYYRFGPAAGVNASITDMVIWLRALLGEYPEVVSQSLIEDITQPRVKTRRELNRKGWREYLNDAHYGLGWRVYDFEGHRLNYHGGWVKGYRADVSFAPDAGVGYVMLMNAESNLINEFTADLWHRYFADLAKRQKVAKVAQLPAVAGNNQSPQ